MNKDFKSWWASFCQNKALEVAAQPNPADIIAKAAWYAALPEPFQPEIPEGCSLAEIEIDGYTFTVVYEHTLEYENEDSKYPYDKVDILNMYPPQEFDAMDMFKRVANRHNMHYYPWKAREAILSLIKINQEDTAICQAASRYEDDLDVY